MTRHVLYSGYEVEWNGILMEKLFLAFNTLLRRCNDTEITMVCRLLLLLLVLLLVCL